LEPAVCQLFTASQIANDREDQSFSDFPLLMPTSPTVALDYLATMHQLSAAFLASSLGSAPSLERKEPDHGKFERDKDGKMEGKHGDVVLHLLATETR